MTQPIVSKRLGKKEIFSTLYVRNSEVIDLGKWLLSLRYASLRFMNC